MSTKRFMVAIVSGALMGLAYEYFITPYIANPIQNYSEKVITTNESN